MYTCSRLRAICALGIGLVLSTLHCPAAKAEVNANHPRLFFDAATLAPLQAQITTTHQAIGAPIQQYVDTLAGTAPPSTAPADGDLDTYRNYGNQLIPLAFTCVMRQAPRACELAKEYLLIYAQWQQWGEQNQRALGHAHMLLGNALAYDWLHNYLTVSEEQLVRQALADWTQKLYEASVGPKREAWNNWWHRSYIQNHYIIINSALGVAGLALAGADGRAQQWIDHAADQLARAQLLLNGSGDGTWHEGISYQTYAYAMALPFLVNLRTLQGRDLFPHVALRNYVDWRLYNYLPGTSRYLVGYGNFEWSYIDSRSPAVLRFAAREYRNGQAEWLVQQLVAERERQVNVWSAVWHVFEFLFYDAAVTAQPPNTLPWVRQFSDLEGVIWRTGWSANDVVFGFKTGAYGGRFAYNTFLAGSLPWNDCAEQGCKFNFGHNHNDSNSFYLYRGAILAQEDTGVNQQKTEFHNTILIDGQGQFRPAEDSLADPTTLRQTDGSLKATVHTPNFAYLAADATQRYRQIDGIETVERAVVFVRPDYFVMLDNLRAAGVHQYEWVSHFGESVTVENTWLRGTAANNQVLGVAVAAPQQFIAQIGQRDQIPYVRLRPTVSGDDLRFAHILYPTDEAGWAAKPAITTLVDSAQATVVRVQLRDGSGWVDEIVLARTQPGAPVTAGPYEFDGQVAVVRRSNNGALEKLFLYGATSLRERATGSLFLSGLDPSQAIETSGGRCQGLTQEAENGALIGAFAIADDAAASGGRYIHVPNGIGDRYAQTDARQQALYCFRVDNTGRYRIKGWVYSTTDTEDSFFVQVDGSPVNSYLWDTPQNTSYQTDYVSDRYNADPVEINLAAGVHQIALFLREDGTRLDKVALEPVVQTAGVAGTILTQRIYLPLVVR